MICVILCRSQRAATEIIWSGLLLQLINTLLATAIHVMYAGVMIDIRKEASTRHHHLESLVYMERPVSVAPSPGTRRPTASAALMPG